MYCVLVLIEYQTSGSEMLHVCMITGVAVINGLVYAVGGFNGSLRVRTVDIYDPIKNVWSAIASMEARRSTLGAAVLNGLIYAVGGFDGSSGSYVLQVPKACVVLIVQENTCIWPSIIMQKEFQLPMLA